MTLAAQDIALEHRTMGKTGWRVGMLGLGCGTHVDDWNAEEERNFTATVHHALDLGIDFFDTADSYNTEEWLGRALGVRQKDVLVATKVGKYAALTGHPLSFAVPEHVYLCCDASLRRLRTDCIDLYLCHLDPPSKPDVFIEAFETLKRQGKIRHWGISTNNVALVRTFNSAGECAACQFDYNMLDRAAEAELIPYCRDNGIATLARRSLDKGILSGRLRADMTFTDWVRQRWNSGAEREAFQRKIARVEQLRFLETPQRSLVQAALQFLFANPDVTCALAGASRPGRLDDYIAAAAGRLTDEELDQIQKI